MSSHNTTTPAKAQGKSAPKVNSGTYISLMALVMMNVTIIGSVANDVQQAYYGLSSVTLFIIGAIVAAIRPPTTTASTMIIIGSIAAIKDCTASSTSSS